MLEPTVNSNQPFPNNHNLNYQSPSTILQQYNHQFQYLQARLASELSFNSFLVQKANQLSHKDLKTSLQDSQMMAFNKKEGTKHREFVGIKVQKFLLPVCPDQKYFVQNKSTINNSKAYSYYQKDSPKFKSQTHSEVKVEEKCQIQFGQVSQKNQTKNIPKNYGKAMLSFIQRNIDRYAHVVKPILHRANLTVSDLLNHIRKHKKEVNSIQYLKQMWGYEDTNEPIYKCIRMLSHIFMRKYCLYYIFSSRIKNYNTHIKYRRRILEGIEKPVQFTCIKQF